MTASTGPTDLSSPVVATVHDDAGKSKVSPSSTARYLRRPIRTLAASHNSTEFQCKTILIFSGQEKCSWVGWALQSALPQRCDVGGARAQHKHYLISPMLDELRAHPCSSVRASARRERGAAEGRGGGRESRGAPQPRSAQYHAGFAPTSKRAAWSGRLLTATDASSTDNREPHTALVL